MRIPLPTPTVDPLPYTRTGNHFGPVVGNPPLFLRGEAIAQFDALLHEINPDAVRVDPDRVQHLMLWLLSLPPETAQDALDRRLRRIEQLRAMLADPAWDTGAATSARLRKLLDYVDREDDLVADQQPLIGLLDDVLLLELAWPAFATEAEEYRDFCNYRDEQHPTGSGDEQRVAWVRDRVAEIALWRHELRAVDDHYAQSGRPGPLFRVS